MWPIRDLSGDVIAFGARKLDDEDDGPKYLNTPETSLFRKSTVLYGADLAKREIAQRRQAVIVEGYTDVMACHLAGVPTAVATCGTSFGEDHIKVLRRLLMDADGLRGEVVFTFDGDAAGQRAALRAFGMEEKFVTQTYVTVQPDGLDPCDLRLAHGDAAVRDLIARRVPLFEFAISGELEHYDLNTTEGQLAALDEAAPIVAAIKDQGPARPVRGQPGPLARLDGRAVRAGPGPGARRAPARKSRGPAGGTRAARRPRPRAPASRTASRADRRPAAAAARPRGEGASLRPARSGGAGGAEALKLAVQRPALCGPEFDALGAGGVHRAGPRGRCSRAGRAPAAARRSGAAGGAGMGGPAARGGAGRAGAGVRDPARRGAAATARVSRTRGTPTVSWPGSGSWPSAGRSPRSSRGCSGSTRSRTRRLQPAVRGSHGAGDTPAGAAGPGRGRLKPPAR